MISQRVFGALACASIACAVSSCAESYAQQTGPIDPQATTETKALFENVKALAKTHVMFGHQDDLAYGHDWWEEPGRSDVREVAGSYPAVYGWDASGLEHARDRDIDSVSFAKMRHWMIDAFQRGGVNTISWHMDNFASGGNAWDTTSAIATILPGGTKHDAYRAALDRFADFALSIRAPSGAVVPIVFRPFHEMNGAWFWWGAGHRTPDQYKQLWRFTVHYLRDTKGVHNLLYAYSPNVGGDRGYDNFLDAYPGDDYVDVLGLDEYFWAPKPEQADPAVALNSHLTWLVDEAERRGKIPALTETGYEAIPDSLWWTKQLLAAIKGGTSARRIAWVLVWRNGNRAIMKREHFYAPYKGHASAPDFVRFGQDSLIMFESDLPPLYLPRGGTGPATRP